MNLLIVNDEKLTADTMAIEMVWERFGIKQIYVAYNFEDGKKNIQEHTIDIMLCDIEMPGKSGIELLRWVKENYSDIECIFLTCHASFEYAREALELGCQNYLLIPAEYEEIGTAVYRVVKRLKERRQDMEYAEFGRKAVRSQVDSVVSQVGEKKSPKAYVEEVLRYIGTHLGEEGLAVQEIADYLHLHPVYLNRIFRKEKGYSIGQYIVNERMALAGKLLESGRLSVNSVAEQTGYGSYSNFNMMFKKYYGCTATQYQDKKN